MSLGDIIFQRCGFFSCTLLVTITEEADFTILHQNTMVIPNVWLIKFLKYFGTALISIYHRAFSQNTSNPNQFNPDRFLYQNDSSNMIDPSEWIFGIGRRWEPESHSKSLWKSFNFGFRICPGRYLAENSLIAIICGILSAFDIRPLQNEPIHPNFSPKHIRYFCTNS